MKTTSTACFLACSCILLSCDRDLLPAKLGPTDLSLMDNDQGQSDQGQSVDIWLDDSNGRDLFDAAPGNRDADCSPPLTVCGATCADLANDSKHCGACEKSCGARQSCAGGVCGACVPLPILSGPILSTTAPQSPGSLSAADIDVDGQLDLLASVSGPPYDGALLLSSPGMGLFTLNKNYGTPMDGASAALFADFFGKGLLDCAVLSPGGFLVYKRCQRDPIFYRASMVSSCFAAGDFNEDGRPDVAVAGDDNGSVTIFLNLNLGNGQLGVSGTFASGKGPRSLVANDWNGDGKVDLAVANHTDNNVGMLLNTGAGKFAPVAYYKAGTGPWACAGTDVDGDGDLDLVVANQDSNDVSVLINQGSAVLAPAQSYPAGKSPTGIAAADFDGDTKIDLAVSDGQGGIALLLNQGTGTFGMPLFFNSGGAGSSIIAADLDRDGKPDVAVPLPVAKAVAVLLNQAAECR